MRLARRPVHFPGVSHVLVNLHALTVRPSLALAPLESGSDCELLAEIRCASGRRDLTLVVGSRKREYRSGADASGAEAELHRCRA